MIFTEDVRCPGFNFAFCSETFASQWLKERIFTACFRTSIVLFYLIFSSVSAMMSAVFEVVICWRLRNRRKLCYVFDNTMNRGKQIRDYVL